MISNKLIHPNLPRFFECLMTVINFKSIIYKGDYLLVSTSRRQIRMRRK